MSIDRKKLREAVDAKNTEAKQAWAAFTAKRDEAKAALTAEELTKEDSPAFQELHELNQKYGTLADEAKRLENRYFQLLEMEDGPASDPESKTNEQAAAGTYGDRFVQSSEYKRLIESGQLFSGSGVKTIPVLVSEFAEVKAAITSAGLPIQPDVRAPVNPVSGNRPALSRVVVSETGSNMVEYVQETSYTNAAAEVAEGAVKPEAGLTFSLVQAAVQVIAHWNAITKQAAADSPQLRSYIDNRMTDGVLDRLEEELLVGDGVAPNLRGILNTSGILTQAKGTDTSVDAILKAITKVRLGNIEPNAVLLHPNDWQEIRLMKDGTSGQYLFGPPSQAGDSTLWGLPMDSSANLTEGTGLVGDFRQAEVWIREGVRVSLSDSHADFFIRNQLVLLAEMRAAFGVLRPAAFASITGI